MERNPDGREEKESRMTNEEALKILDTIPTIGDQVDALEMAIKALEQDTVSRAVYLQCAWERDVAIEQLKELGYSFGEKIRTDNDTISRQAAIDAVCKACSMDTDYHNCTGYKPDSDWCDELVALRLLPSAHPERKKRKWLPDNNCYHTPHFICSACGVSQEVDTVMYKPSWAFCPLCGADMRGEQDG